MQTHHADYSDLIEMVAQFDAGEITRREFQRRARALTNERLVMLSQVLTKENLIEPATARQRPFCVVERD